MTSKIEIMTGSGSSVSLQVDKIASVELTHGRQQCYCGSGKRQAACHSSVNERTVSTLLEDARKACAERTATQKLCVKDCEDCDRGDMLVTLDELYCLLDYIGVTHGYDDSLVDLLPKPPYRCHGSLLIAHQDSYRISIYEVRPAGCRNSDAFVKANSSVSENPSQHVLFFDNLTDPRELEPLTFWIRGLDNGEYLTASLLHKYINKYTEVNSKKQMSSGRFIELRIG